MRDARNPSSILKEYLEEALEIAEARAEIEVGKGIKVEDVWRELGI